MQSYPAGPFLSQTVQYAQPTVGQTVTVTVPPGNPYNQNVIIDPAGALLSLTVALPATAPDGAIVSIMSTQTITTLTMSVATIVGALTGLVGNAFGCYVCRSNTWYRIG